MSKKYKSQVRGEKWMQESWNIKRKWKEGKWKRNVYRKCWKLLSFSHSVMSDSLWPQDFWFPCHSPSPGACSNSCLLSQWCHPTIRTSVFPFSSCLQSFSASESFLMSDLFSSDGQSIGLSDSTSVLPMNIQNQFPLGLTGQEASPTPQFRSSSSALSSLYSPFLTSVHDYWKNRTFDYMDLCWQSNVSAL